MLRPLYGLFHPVAASVALRKFTASQFYVERVFSVCGHFTSGKRNWLRNELANIAFTESE